jgi:hypothetical protein
MPAGTSGASLVATRFDLTLLARRGRTAYAAHVKVGSEGRSDRLVPLLAQAVLEARRYLG